MVSRLKINHVKDCDDAALIRCITKIIKTYKHVDEMQNSELLTVTRKKADKRHTRRTKTLEQKLQDIEADFGEKIYMASMSCIYNHLNKHE